MSNSLGVIDGHHQQMRVHTTTATAATTTQSSPYSKLWVVFVYSFSILSTIGFGVSSGLLYKPKVVYILPTLIGIDLAMGIVYWFRGLLSMNLWRERNTTRNTTIILYGFSAIVNTASALAVTENIWTLQFTSSLARSVIIWFAFLAVYSGSYAVPSSQQVGSLFQILVVTLMWEVRTYVINRHFIEEAS